MADSENTNATEASSGATVMPPSAARSVAEGSETRPSHDPESSASKQKPRGLPNHVIYALPAPIRTFPLPSFYPDNPLSLIHVAVAWISQLLFPAPNEPSVIHKGIWSPATRSVQITDPKSIRALWEQGFYGKGNYSRSEPNWLKREQNRRSLSEADQVAEQYTNRRRVERQQMKWERARKEQEAIERTRMQEAWQAPVGPLELLALPNSDRDLLSNKTENVLPLINQNDPPIENDCSADGVLNGSAKPNGVLVSKNSLETDTGREIVAGVGEDGRIPFPSLNGTVDHAHTLPDNICTSTSSSSLTSEDSKPSFKRRKSVRFSPRVESTTFQQMDPPSPKLKGTNGKFPNGSLPNGNSTLSKESSPVSTPPTTPSGEADPRDPLDDALGSTGIVDIEHLQLTKEEAFFLAFGLGALTVEDPSTKKSLNTSELFTLFRRHSHFPPRTSSEDLQMDDPFLIHYAVYHHFRSLGWVPRSGIKFGVDWLLYHRGPVFSHAEFAVIVLPAYSDPYWKSVGRQPPRKSWHWLHMINRVESTALKTLVLVYVDIPPPMTVEPETSMSGLLKRYKIREVIVKRWLSNRNRD